MADFRIFEAAQFLKDLERDFSGQRGRIQQKLSSYVYPQLHDNPYVGKNIKKLKEFAPETWRYRIGDYRFFYAIDGPRRVVSMLAIDHRGRAY